MFKTRKRMAQEIEVLTRERDHYKMKSALMDANPLPKCESLACVSCIHAVYQRDQFGGIHLIGCGRERKCSDYAPDEHFTYDERVQAMRRQAMQAQ